MNEQRYHAFDALRAAMMILGVVLHSATCYATYPGVWWLKDPRTTVTADLILIFLHAFRLPAFFVMSGFFGAMLVERRGWQGFLESRAARLGLPGLLCLLACYPVLKLTTMYFYFARQAAGGPWAATVEWVRRGQLERTMEPMHLWFLETLMLCALVTVAARPWVERVVGGAWFGRLVTRRWAAAALAPVTGLTLLATEFGVLDTPHDFGPNVRVLVSYLVFYFVGWGLYLHRGRLEELRRGGWAELGLALVSGLGMVILLDRQTSDRTMRHWPELAGTAALAGLTAWLMIFGLMRVFLRRAPAPSARVRYLADSAYWLYLMHPVVLVGVQVPMMGLGWPGEVKMVMGFLAAMPVLLWTYERWVRGTWVGVVLQGRRYERAGSTAAAASPARMTVS